jgi:integrase
MLKSHVKNWGRSYRKLFNLAKVKGHPHRFRHTFAVNLLRSGEVTMEDVSAMLGHSSVKITEENYAKWAKGRQDALEVRVDNAWSAIETPTPRSLRKLRKAPRRGVA